MANPQTENGFIKIANELWDEILRRDFTKRQQNIIMLIWRLSYGCGQKECEIPKLNYFELVGLNKSDIKKEIKYLFTSNVINWEEKTSIYSINKDYERWQISPNKSWDFYKFREIVALNLSRKKVGKIPTSECEEVGKIPTLDEKVVGKIQTKSDELVGKTPTSELVKYQPEQPPNPCGSKAEEGSKYIIKDIIKNNNYEKEEDITRDKPNPFRFYEENGFGTIPSTVAEDINYWIDGNFFEEPESIIVRAMREATVRNVKNWKYVEKILQNWEKQKLRNLEQIEAYTKNYENRFRDRTSSGGEGNAKHRGIDQSYREQVSQLSL